MKKRRFVLYFVFMSCLLFFCGAADAAERVLRMDVEARVESDSSLVVTERIAFVAEHVEIRCGLIRDIPIVVSEKGRRVTAKFEVLDVKQDGRPAHYELHRAGRNMEIHLGDDTMLSKGQHEYVVTYRITDQLIFHDDADELYWNVTGNDWIFPIEHATFRVKLPEGAAVVERDAATGAFGAKGADWRRNDDALGESFETTRTLAPGEGFTVMVAWPKGFVAPPPKTGVDAFVDRFGFDNLFAASALFVFVCYSLLWFSVGRDPKRGTIYPAWDPPDGLGPAYIGYARKLEWDTDLLLADLIDLAVRGYLILEPGEKYLTLSRVSSESGEKSWDDLSPPQRQLMEVLFPTGIYTRRLGGDPAAVGSEAAKFTRKLQKLLPVFYGIKKASRSERGYSVSRRAPLVKLNRGAVFLGLLSFVPMLLLVVHIIDWDEPAMLIAFAFLVIFSTIVVRSIATLIFRVIPSMFRTLRLNRKAKKGGAFALYVIAVVVLAMTFFFFAHIVFVIVMLFGAFGPPELLPEYSLLGWVGLAVASAVLFTHYMDTRTAAGRALLDKIEGFEMYLKTAERHRLEKLYPAETLKARGLDKMPDRTPHLFERLLPYAFALGIAETWADSFAPILEAADYNPTWQRGGDFNPHAFASSMGRMQSAMRTPSKGGGGGSGRGGGTSSGGGRGGGGGRGR